MTGTLLRIGTRGSPLALAQAHETKGRLAAAFPELAPEGAVEIVIIHTMGDKILDRTLAEAGGKGLFTKEIEDALLEDRVDLAVHSMKDVPTWLPDGLHLAAMLPREDVRDAWFSLKAKTPDDLPQGAVVGTASLRRQAQLLARRPDLRIVPIRGNVQTRLRKLAEGEVDATMLAVAGMRRLGTADRITSIIETDVMLPAVAQGAIGLECRVADEKTNRYLAALNCPATMTRVTAERAVLSALDGSCRTPIAALAVLDGSTVHLDALVIRGDGREAYSTRRSGPAADAIAMGDDAGQELKAKLPPDFFDPAQAVGFAAPARG